MSASCADPSMPIGDARADMQYAILCYHDEKVTCAWSKEQDDAVMAKLGAVMEKLTRQGKLGPVARLLPTTAATTLRKDREPALVIDGPFAETKEQLLGFYIVDCASLDEALDIARELGAGQSRRRLRDPARRRVLRCRQGRLRHDRSGWIGAVLTAARPQAMAALLRYFRNLDTAEEAFQEASLRALKAWPKNGPPRDAAAWLIMVGKNAGIDAVRRTGRQAPLPPEEVDLRSLGRRERRPSSVLDAADYRDDILRLLFICCHPELPATQQIALALRIVSGLSVKQIARAFLVSEAAMEQRITRAKARVACAERAVRDAGRRRAGGARRGRRGHDLSRLQRGLHDATSPSSGAKAPLCEEAIRLARLLLGLYPTEPEIMGLAALLLLQHARAPARFDAGGAVVLLEDQDRALWNRKQIAEGLALIDKAVRHRRPGPYQVQAAIAALHARAARAEDTDWGEIELLYGTLERMQPSPVVTLNRAVAVSKARGPEAALAMIEPLGSQARRLLLFPRRARRVPARSSAGATRRALPSIAPSRSPTRRPRPRTSDDSSTGLTAGAHAARNGAR